MIVYEAIIQIVYTTLDDVFCPVQLTSKATKPQWVFDMRL